MPLPANLGTFTLDDTFIDLVTGAAIPNVDVAVTYPGVYGDPLAAGGAVSLVGGTYHGKSNSSGQLTKDGTGTPAGNPFLLPVSNDVDVSQPMVLSIVETYPSGLVVGPYSASVDTSLQNTHILLQTIRNAGALPTGGADAGGGVTMLDVETYVNNRLTALGAQTIVDPVTGLIPSSKLGTAAFGTLLIEDGTTHMVVPGAVSVIDIPTARKIRTLGIIAEVPSLGGDLSIVAYWIGAAGTVLDTHTVTLTARTELSDFDAISWDTNAGDVVILVPSCSGQFTGHNVRCYLLGIDMGDPASAQAAPGAPSGLAVSSGVLSWVAGTGVVHKHIITVGSGGAETFLAVVYSAVGNSLNVSGIAPGSIFNVHSANRDAASSATTIGAVTYSNDFAGSSIDTTRIGFTAPTNTTDLQPTGFAPGITQSGQLRLWTGEVGGFAAGDVARYWIKIASADYSTSDLDNKLDFYYETTGELDYYWRAATTALASGDNRYCLKLFNFGFRVLKRISSTDTYLVATSSTTQAFAIGSLSTGAWYTLRMLVSGTSMKGKVYQQGAPEPTTGGPLNDGWDFTITDSGIAGPGKCVRDGIGPNTANTQRRYDIDNEVFV